MLSSSVFWQFGMDKCIAACLLCYNNMNFDQVYKPSWWCLQVAQMAAADGRQSSGDQSEAAAELVANSSHHGLTKQTSQPVSASQQDAGGLYTNGSAGVGARSSTGAQKALTMEDLQVCRRHDSSGRVHWLVQRRAASDVCLWPSMSCALRSCTAHK